MANYGIQFKDKNGNNYYPCPFPVGFVVFTASKVNPSTYWGGTWEQLYGGYLYLCQNSAEKTSYTGLNTQQREAFTSGSTTLTAAQSGLPSHTHSYSSSRWYWSEAAGGGDVIGEQSTTSYKFGRETAATGGRNASKGHTHPIPAHAHNIATVGFFAWKRTA